MLKAIIRWANRQIRDSEKKIDIDSYGSKIPSVTSLSGNGNNGMNFVVYGATGGKIVEFSSYDQHTDRQTRNLYIVTDKEDLGEELNLIITKESLTR